MKKKKKKKKKKEPAGSYGALQGLKNVTKKKELNEQKRKKMRKRMTCCALKCH